MDDYQLRKDIDRLRSFFDELEKLYLQEFSSLEGKTLADIFAMYYDQSEVDEIVGILKDGLETANSEIEELETELAGKSDVGHPHTKSDITDINSWTPLYDGTFGVVKTDGHLVYCHLISGQDYVYADNWHTIANMSNLSGVTSTHYPRNIIYAPYQNQITLRLNTNGSLEAIRYAGQTTGKVQVEFTAVYAIW